MNVYETLLAIPFYLAIGLSLVSLAAFKNMNRIMKHVPRAAILSGIVYFVSAQIYYSLEDVILTVPIRIDLLFLPPFLLIPLFAEIVNRKVQKTEPAASGQRRSRAEPEIEKQ